MELRLTLAPDVQQVAAGGGRRPTRNEPPPRLPYARAILLRHRTAPGRSLDCGHHRDGGESRRVQQVPSDVLVDRDRGLAPSGASAGAAATVVHRRPRPHLPHGADAAAQPSRGGGGGEDPPQRRGRPSSGRWKRCESRQRRVRRNGIDPCGRRARGGQRLHGRRRELYRRPRIHLIRSGGRARKGQRRGPCCLTAQWGRIDRYGRIGWRALVPRRLSGRTRCAAKEPPRLERGTCGRRRRSPARAQRLAACARRGDVVVTVHRWLSEELLERDVVVAVGRSLGGRTRVQGKNWGSVWFA